MCAYKPDISIMLCKYKQIFIYFSFFSKNVFLSANKNKFVFLYFLVLLRTLFPTSLSFLFSFLYHFGSYMKTFIRVINNNKNKKTGNIVELKWAVKFEIFLVFFAGSFSWLQSCSFKIMWSFYVLQKLKLK